MKKLITNNKFAQKIFLSIIVVLLLSFAVPIKSQADFGGILIDPIVDLIGTICDVITGGLQTFLVDGKLNNSDDSAGVLNAFLVDKNSFKEKVEESYPEFIYSDANGEAQVVISEDELDKDAWSGKGNYAIPVPRYTPDKIFSGLIPALDINFVDPKDWGSQEENNRSIAQQLHETIATWYVSLRNLAAVGLMLVLVYVGIRIVISSTASDKSKYKQMLMDWVVALCLLFCLHYIMTFTITIVDEISKTINGAADNNGNNIAVTVTKGSASSSDTTEPGHNGYTDGPNNNSDGTPATKNVCSNCRCENSSSNERCCRRSVGS